MELALGEGLKSHRNGFEMVRPEKALIFVCLFVCLA